LRIGKKILAQQGLGKSRKRAREEGTFEEGVADGLRIGKKILAQQGSGKSKKNGEEDLRKLVARVKGKTK